jgi:hypothetical protein
MIRARICIPDLNVMAMKTFFTIILTLSVNLVLAQTTRRVNADPAIMGVNVYHNLQEAHDAAADGDILIIEPGASVGSLNCNKMLTIYGRGYFLDKNPAYVDMPDKASNSVVDGIDIFSDNCKISGLYGSWIKVHEGASGNVISRNRLVAVILQSTSAPGISNTTVTQNYITTSTGLLPGGDLTGYIYISGSAAGPIANLVISNNLMYSIDYALGDSNNYSGILIDQNTMNSAPYQRAYGSVITNNILYNSNQHVQISADVVNTTYNYNVSFGQSVFDAGVGTNNVIVADPSQFDDNSGGSEDNAYRLLSSSALKTLSATGGEVGMFGGTTPYMQFGTPAAPAILKLTTTGIGNASTPITVTVSAKSNH